MGMVRVVFSLDIVENKWARIKNEYVRQAIYLKLESTFLLFTKWEENGEYRETCPRYLCYIFK
jgi:hypothetical protein